MLLPIEVPGSPERVLVSGTGLTHLGSAKDRQAMHVQHTIAAAKAMTDSMRMFELGIAGGRPREGEIGVAPEWFYKGHGDTLQAPFAPLTVPAHAEDGGEEAEIAGIYLIADDGVPHRIGMCQGNEFSDHRFERHNYLNLAGSKLRQCSIGPELVVGTAFRSIAGEVSIERGGLPLWHKAIETGEENMSHSLANLEHHHFKFDGHRAPGTVHVHFFGAHSLSFGEGSRMAIGCRCILKDTAAPSAIPFAFRIRSCINRCVCSLCFNHRPVRQRNGENYDAARRNPWTRHHGYGHGKKPAQSRFCRHSL
jgi:hypothetical protein